MFASAEVVMHRQEVCRTCDRYQPLLALCGVCHCFMPVKARLAAAECPLKKWGAVQEDQSHVDHHDP